MPANKETPFLLAIAHLGGVIVYSILSSLCCPALPAFQDFQCATVPQMFPERDSLVLAYRSHNGWSGRSFGHMMGNQRATSRGSFPYHLRRRRRSLFRSRAEETVRPWNRKPSRRRRYAGGKRAHSRYPSYNGHRRRQARRKRKDRSRAEPIELPPAPETGAMKEGAGRWEGQQPPPVQFAAQVEFWGSDANVYETGNIRETAAPTISERHRFYEFFPIPATCSVLHVKTAKVGQRKGKHPSMTYVRRSDPHGDFFVPTRGRATHIPNAQMLRATVSNGAATCMAISELVVAHDSDTLSNVTFVDCHGQKVVVSPTRKSRNLATGDLEDVNAPLPPAPEVPQLPTVASQPDVALPTLPVLPVVSDAKSEEVRDDDLGKVSKAVDVSDKAADQAAKTKKGEMVHGGA